MKYHDPRDFRDAIGEGRAYDAERYPEETRKMFEDRIGWMREAFNDIDAAIERNVKEFSKGGVAFYADVNSTIDRWILLNLPKYLKFSFDVLREDMEELVGEDRVKIVETSKEVQNVKKPLLA